MLYQINGKGKDEKSRRTINDGTLLEIREFSISSISQATGLIALFLLRKNQEHRRGFFVFLKPRLVFQHVLLFHRNGDEEEHRKVDEGTEEKIPILGVGREEDEIDAEPNDDLAQIIGVTGEPPKADVDDVFPRFADAKELLHLKIANQFEENAEQDDEKQQKSQRGEAREGRIDE